MAHEVRVGLIGVGAVAQIAHLPAYHEIPDARVVALCDQETDKARAVAEKFAVERTFRDYESVVRAGDIEMVDICLPNHLHAPVAIAALEHGKHVLCEVPLGRDLDEATAIVNAARAAQRVLMVGYNHRFRRDAAVVRKCMDDGDLGRVYRVQVGWLRRSDEYEDADWRREARIAGGGALVDLGIRLLDLALFLQNHPKVASVTASVHPLDPDGRMGEQSAAVLLLLEDGGSIELEVAWSPFLERERLYARFFGTHGAANLIPLRIARMVRGAVRDITPPLAMPRNLYRQSFVEEIRHLIRCIRGEVTCLAPGEEALQTKRLLQSIYKSARERREVRVA